MKPGFHNFCTGALRAYGWLLACGMTLNGYGQKPTGKGTVSIVNLGGQYKSVTSRSLLVQRLADAQFPALASPAFGGMLELSVYGERVLAKLMLGASGLAEEQKNRTEYATTTYGLQVGPDWLPLTGKTVLGPFIGARLFKTNLTGTSATGAELDARKNNLDLMAGFGLLHFFNKKLKGVINNVDIDVGVSLPLINGHWKKAGASFVEDVYRQKAGYFMTLTLGYAFQRDQ